MLCRDSPTPLVLLLLFLYYLPWQTPLNRFAELVFALVLTASFWCILWLGLFRVLLVRLVVVLLYHHHELHARAASASFAYRKGLAQQGGTVRRERGCRAAQSADNRATGTNYHACVCLYFFCLIAFYSNFLPCGFYVYIVGIDLQFAIVISSKATLHTHTLTHLHVHINLPICICMRGYVYRAVVARWQTKRRFPADLFILRVCV